jgi:hypothetical protein
MPEFNFVWLLRLLSFIIPIISIITWNGSFLRSLIHDVEDEHATNIKDIDMQIHIANLSLLLATRIFAILLFGMVWLVDTGGENVILVPNYRINRWSIGREKFP